MSKSAVRKQVVAQLIKYAESASAIDVADQRTVPLSTAEARRIVDQFPGSPAALGPLMREQGHLILESTTLVVVDVRKLLTKVQSFSSDREAILLAVHSVIRKLLKAYPLKNKQNSNQEGVLLRYFLEDAILTKLSDCSPLSDESLRTVLEVLSCVLELYLAKAELKKKERAVVDSACNILVALSGKYTLKPKVMSIVRSLVAISGTTAENLSKTSAGPLVYESMNECPEIENPSDGFESSASLGVEDLEVAMPAVNLALARTISAPRTPECETPPPALKIKASSFNWADCDSEMEFNSVPMSCGCPIGLCDGHHC